MIRWLWIFPISAVLLCAIVFFYWGWGWVSASLIALIILCATIMIWRDFLIHKVPADNFKLDSKHGKGKQ